VATGDVEGLPKEAASLGADALIITEAHGDGLVRIRIDKRQSCKVD
jgi:hypothetical protein